MPAGTVMNLQITSMADIFMIILVFMLKGYGSGIIDIIPSAGMEMAHAASEGATVEALKVEVLEGGVMIEGKPVAVFKNFTFEPVHMKQLSAALETERKKLLMIVRKNGDVGIDSRIIVVADQRAPYSTIKTVLSSAAVNGYTDFKLAVVNP